MFRGEPEKQGGWGDVSEKKIEPGTQPQKEPRGDLTAPGAADGQRRVCAHLLPERLPGPAGDTGSRAHRPSTHTSQFKDDIYCAPAGPGTAGDSKVQKTEICPPNSLSAFTWKTVKEKKI